MHDHNGPAPTIEWVNHASFVTNVGNTRLMCDPWFEGSAFNRGWSLISPTVFPYERFSEITHLWISHQHPDHFAPGTLRRIPPDCRARVEVLYGKRADRLVASWLLSNGFKHVVEVDCDCWQSLDADTKIMCGLHDDDSWLALRTPWGTLLNVNDCVLKRARDVERIAELVGPVDVLFTQFSYAQWTGNPEDTELRKRDAAEKLDRLRLQDCIFRPRAIVPFASYIYFSNVENFFLNDGVNDVGRVAAFIEGELGKQAVVLYPGELQCLSEPCDWHRAAERYAGDFSKCVDGGPVLAPTEESTEALERQIGAFLNRLRRKNPAVVALVRGHTTFYLTDAKVGYELSVRGLRRISISADAADIATSADNVAYAFRTPWGGNTLHVSGRFTSHPPGDRLRFFDLMHELHHYNQTTIDGEWLFSQCVRVVRGATRRLRWAATAGRKGG